MILRARKKDDERVYGPIDYLLTGVYSCLAVYATAIAVGVPSVAWVFCSFVAVGTAFSYFMQHYVGNKPVAKLDSWLYMGVGVLSIIFRQELVNLLPENPFERNLVIAGAFCWFMSFGSFFTWRDGTLLFQAVPCIALFGMVGVFDTFANAIWLFYAFILSLATLFARAHRRMMIEQAEASGFKAMLAAEERAKGRSARKEPGGGAMLRAFHNGPWRWVAGPEWGLASALIVVLVTMVGAPVIRASLSSISGRIPRLTPRNSNPVPPMFRAYNDEGRVNIGMGPMAISETPVLRIKLDSAEYLRGRTFDEYGGAEIGWGNTFDTGRPSPGSDLVTVSLNEADKSQTFTFWVDILQPYIGSVPMPGTLTNARNFQIRYAGNSLQVRRDGTVRINRGTLRLPRVEAQAVIPTESKLSGKGTLPSEYQRMYTNVERVTDRVRDWALQETRNATTDYEKARALKAAIERTAQYNLRAAAVPVNRDPVEYFLFDLKEGYCDLFATTMVMTARSVGIPARYATGFYPMSNQRDPGDPTVQILQERDAHAWAELYFEGAGWVVFDATENAIEVPAGERGGATVTKPFWEQDWFPMALNILIGVLILTSGLVTFVVYVRARKNKQVTVSDVGREYERFARALERISGRRRQLSDTPDEFLAMTSPVLGGSLADAQLLNQKFVRALYANTELTMDVVKDLRASTDEFRKKAKKAPPPPQRRKSKL